MMSSRGRTASRAGSSASRSSSSTTGSSNTSTSSGSSSASTSSSSKGSTSSSGSGASRSSRSGSSTSSVSVSSPSASKTVTTTTTTTPATTTAPAKTTRTTTATPQAAITVSTDLARAITESQAKFPDAWSKATGTTNIIKQFEQVTGTTIPIMEQIQDIELLPEVMAEEERIEEERIEQIEQAPIYERLSDQVQTIIDDINAGNIQVPDWFHNNIEWVQTGHISEAEFFNAYNYLVQEQIVHTPLDNGLNEKITNDMITQHLDHFTIENGRAKGQITFRLTDKFNPFYYDKDITNIIQFKTKAGANILPFVKENRLRFTATERDEIIQYDESVGDNTTIDLESFVWLGTTQPTAFSSVLRSEIKQGQDATVTTTNEGFLGAGLGISAIAFAIVAGYFIDMRRKIK